MKQKYVITSTHGPIIFTDLISHSDFNRRFDVISAGFVDLRDGQVSCFGESLPLNMKSRGAQDAQIIAADFGLEVRAGKRTMNKQNDASQLRVEIVHRDDLYDNDETIVHIGTYAGAPYATLCGCDGYDESVGQKMMDEDSDKKVDCPDCISIFNHCRAFDKKHIKDQ